MGSDDTQDSNLKLYLCNGHKHRHGLCLHQRALCQVPNHFEVLQQSRFPWNGFGTRDTSALQRHLRSDTARIQWIAVHAENLQ